MPRTEQSPKPFPTEDMNLLDLISIVLLTLHLVCMNIASGVPLLCSWLLLPKFQDRYADARQTTLQLALWANWTLVMGVVLGLALGISSVAGGDSRLFHLLPMFRYKVGWGLIELMFSAVCMLGFWSGLRFRPPNSSVGRWFLGALPVLSATNLLYHFPLLLTVMSKAARGDIQVTEPVGADIFRQLAFQPNIIAHALHFVLASVAVAGIFLFWVVRRSEHSMSYCVTGARFAFVATLLQIPTGLWLLFVTPPSQQGRLIGGDFMLSGLFVASIFCAFHLLQNLAALAIGEIHERLPKRCAIWMFATVLLMSATLHHLRG